VLVIQIDLEFMKVIFAGTPDFAAAALTALCGSRHPVVAVLTQPDRPSGRGMKLQPSPVKTLALSFGLPVIQPSSLKDQAIQQALRELGADILVVAAYGLILPQAVLDIPWRGAINIHASLLPRWRGAAPIQRAILAGDRETGICIMQMDAGLDTGPILLEERLEILDADTAGTLHDKLSSVGARLVVTALDGLESKSLESRPQAVEGATYAKKLGKAEAHIVWSRPAEEIWRLIRTFDPFPGASTTFENEAVKLYCAQLASEFTGSPGQVLVADGSGVVVACGHGAILVKELQRAGGRRLAAKEFLRGIPITAGASFGA